MPMTDFPYQNVLSIGSRTGVQGEIHKQSFAVRSQAHIENEIRDHQNVEAETQAARVYR